MPLTWLPSAAAAAWTFKHEQHMSQIGLFWSHQSWSQQGLRLLAGFLDSLDLRTSDVRVEPSFMEVFSFPQDLVTSFLMKVSAGQRPHGFTPGVCTINC